MLIVCSWHGFPNDLSVQWCSQQPCIYSNIFSGNLPLLQNPFHDLWKQLISVCLTGSEDSKRVCISGLLFRFIHISFDRRNTCWSVLSSGGNLSSSFYKNRIGWRNCVRQTVWFPQGGCREQCSLWAKTVRYIRFIWNKTKAHIWLDSEWNTLYYSFSS